MTLQPPGSLPSKQRVDRQRFHAIATAPLEPHSEPALRPQRQSRPPLRAQSHPYTLSSPKRGLFTRHQQFSESLQVDEVPEAAGCRPYLLNGR